VYLLGVKVAGA